MEVNILENIQKRNEEKARELEEKMQAVLKENMKKRQELNQRMMQEISNKMNKVTEDHFGNF